MDDHLTLFELDQYFKRHNITDEEFSSDDRKLVFELVDKKNNGSILVNDLLKRAEQQEFQDNEHKKDMLQVREFLKKHIDEVRAEREVTVSKHPEIDEIKRRKQEEINEKQLIKKALGHKSFDLDVEAMELNEIIERAGAKSLRSQEEHKFARFLRNGNLALHRIPFYDMRAHELDLLKHRTAWLEHELTAGQLTKKFEKLAETRFDGSKTTLNWKSENMQPQRATSPIARSYSDTSMTPDKGFESKESKMELSKSLPNLKVRPSPLASPKQPNCSPMVSESPVPMKVLQKSLSDVKPQRSARNLLLNSKGVDIDDQSIPSNYETKSVSSSPGKYLKPIVSKEKKLFENNESQSSDFYVSVVDGSEAMGRMKDASKVMRIEKVDPDVYTYEGKRLHDIGSTDWSRVGVGGDRVEGDVGYGAIEDRFLTTTNKYYPPLIYEPSKPVTRNILSEAESDTAKRERRRQERRARVEANLEVTKTRLEYEELQKQVREYSRSHTRAELALKYKTSMLLNDLKHYKQQPLERMAKKPNLALYEQMWGGNLRHDTLVSHPENRDFNTTYNSSFDSSILITENSSPVK